LFFFLTFSIAQTAESIGELLFNFFGGRLGGGLSRRALRLLDRPCDGSSHSGLRVFHHVVPSVGGQRRKRNISLRNALETTWTTRESSCVSTL